MKGSRYGTSGLDPKSTAGAATLKQEQDSGAAFEFTERKDPTFVQFGDGETVTGVLLRIERVEVTKDGRTKSVPRLVVEDMDTKEQFSFLATYQIAAKIRRSDIGHVIEVRCEGNDTSVQTKGNPMKKFRVRVSNRTAPGYADDGSIIGDDDLPAELA